ncbi:hypothetical protein [Amycolatopsis sp. A1MSW2902]|uniref:hypothetical protein n=1 Tax=Amycolatopsis sp. A1MSW2902 TaxID=687413 RepID=UPI00307EB3DC
MLTEERKDATRAVVRELAKLKASKLCPPEFKAGTPVVVALDGELATDVLARVTSYAPPVVLAVYYPSSGRLEILTVEPRQGQSTRGTSEDRIRTHRNSTIGMVVDAGGDITVPQQWQESYQTHKLASAKVAH